MELYYATYETTHARCLARKCSSTQQMPISGRHVAVKSQVETHPRGRPRCPPSTPATNTSAQERARRMCAPAAPAAVAAAKTSAAACFYSSPETEPSRKFCLPRLLCNPPLPRLNAITAAPSSISPRKGLLALEEGVQAHERLVQLLQLLVQDLHLKTQPG